VKGEAMRFEFVKRSISYLCRRRFYVMGAVALLAAVMFIIGWTVGRSSLIAKLGEVTALHEKLEAEYMAFQAEREKSPQLREEISYSKRYTIDTSHIAAAGVTLGKGEVFEGRLSIRYGSIVFWISDPYWYRVVDAGRIEGEYEFAFVVEKSGEYRLVFDDSEGSLIIHLDYNSPSSLTDASVRQQ